MRHGIRNIPSPLAAANLSRVTDRALEPIRSHFGKPFKITSGYRGPALNAKVGGSATSNHCLGCAVDGEIKGIPNYDVAKWAAENLDYWDEIILEAYHSSDPNSGWIHLAVRPGGEKANRKKVLTWNRADGYRRDLIK